MKKLIYLFLAFFPSVIIQAQDAKSILDATAASIRKLGATEVSFEATSFEGTTPIQTMQGRMSLDGNKFLLESKGLTVWYNGNTQWSYLHSGSEVNITEPTPEELQQVNPYAFMDVYKDGYKLAAKKSKLHGKETYEIQLKATSKGKPADIIYVDVLRSDYTPLCIRIKQGKDWSRISLKKISGHQKFPTSHFTFIASEYPNLELIDLR